MNAETPAHITIYVYWLNNTEMEQFEAVYEKWLNPMPGDDIEDIKYRLIKFLSAKTLTFDGVDDSTPSRTQTIQL